MNAARLSTAALLAFLPVAAAQADEPKPVPALTLTKTGPDPRAPARSIHPQVPLLDDAGKKVSETRRPLSLMKSCGGCHDTGYIAKHNYHAQAGLDEMHTAGSRQGSRSWDTGPGLFGRWDPLTYRWLSPPGAGKLDLGTAEWIQVMGPRHVGGGPAVFSRRTGERLTGLEAAGKTDPETHVLDPVSGEPRVWDWKQSGTMELNCLLCHMKAPNNAERIREIQAGRFQWASAATLLGTGLITRDEAGLTWNPELIDGSGEVNAEVIGISDPRSDNCRLCHSKACRCKDPVVFENSLQNWATETTGTVFSPERLFDSGMNLEGKEGLSTPWDVHAERLVDCANCHHAMNNPAYNRKESEEDRPRHLAFDARRLSESAYLINPDHNLAKGHTSQGTVARRFDGTMRDCRDCHDALAVHDFLPYKEVHFDRLGCETCHIPRVYAPVRQMTDWTLLDLGRGPVVSHRGLEGPVNDPTTLIEGYNPVLLLHEETGEKLRLGPHNLITSWFWVEGEPEHPVRSIDLERALLTPEGAYHPDLLAALDTDKDGKIREDELRLDSDTKVDAVKKRLQEVGVVQPRIRGEIQPYNISHGVQSASSAVRCCLCCHGFDSRVTAEVELSAYMPGGVLPRPVGDAASRFQGDMHQDDQGRLVFTPSLDPEVLYIHGTNHLGWLDYLGILSVLGSLFGVALHGGLRIVSQMKRKRGGAA